MLSYKNDKDKIYGATGMAVSLVVMAMSILTE